MQKLRQIAKKLGKITDINVSKYYA